MSGQLDSTRRGALLTPEQAGVLLDEVIYERVLALMDLDALWRLEQELWFELGAVDGVDEDHVPDLAKAMIDRALARIVLEPRRYMKMGPPTMDPEDDDCALCQSAFEDAAKDDAARRKRAREMIPPRRETS